MDSSDVTLLEVVRDTFIPCYAVYDYDDFRIGFQAVWTDQDMVWMRGLAKQAGIASKKPNAAFLAQNWHFTGRELAALGACLDARDTFLFGPDEYHRQIVNLPAPERYDAAADAVARNSPRFDSQIWVPDDTYETKND